MRDRERCPSFIARLEEATEIEKQIIRNHTEACNVKLWVENVQSQMGWIESHNGGNLDWGYIDADISDVDSLDIPDALRYIYEDDTLAGDTIDDVWPVE